MLHFNIKVTNIPFCLKNEFTVNKEYQVDAMDESHYHAFNDKLNLVRVPHDFASIKERKKILKG